VQLILHLSKVSEDPLPGQIKPAPPPVIINGEEEYEVEHIKDSFSFPHQIQYWVNGRATIIEAGNQQSMWMDFKQSISSMQNSQANPDQEPPRDLVCGKGSYCHSCTK
jgi:hypothetical protein